MTLARYQMGRTLGAGGMGRVWQAHDSILGRDVALKEILLPARLTGADRDALHNQTLREARAAARLSHPAVVRVYDTFEDDGRAWIVMEYVASRSLQQAIDADGPMAPAEVARVGLSVLAALGAAHAAGVRHRDVKPANVLLADDGRVVLTDFGVAAVDGESIATSSGLVIGSPQYMAPERVRDGAASPAADLWSLGATLYAAVEGRSPYNRGSVMETITAIAADEPDPPLQAGALRPVLDGLLRKDPSDRLDLAQTERMLREVIDPPPPPPGRKPLNRRRTALVAGGVAALLAVAAVGWVVVSRPDTPGKPEAVAPTTAPPASAPATESTSPAQAQATSPAPSRSALSPTTPVAAGSTRPPRPAGWIDYHDPTGFSVYVPAGWRKSKEGSIVYFRSAGRVLGIDQTDSPQWNPVADWEGKAEYRVSAGDFPQYHEIGIDEVKYFLKAADWEFTFTRGGVRQHVNNRGVVTSKHQAYGFYWQTTDAAWAGAQKDLQLVFASFRPAED